jgi:hypothetical protein
MSNMLDHGWQGPRTGPIDYVEEGESFYGVLERAQSYKEMSIGCYRQAVMAFHMGRGDLAKEMSNKGSCYFLLLPYSCRFLCGILGHTGKQYKMMSTESFRKIAHLLRRDGRSDIDLHGLHVESAVSLVDELITLFKEEGIRGGRRFQIITGAGLHSQGKRARLKPAIQNLLRSRGIQFHELNSGTLEAVIK